MAAIEALGEKTIAVLNRAHEDVAMVEETEEVVVEVEVEVEVEEQLEDARFATMKILWA